jgi:hypothetical protein
VRSVAGLQTLLSALELQSLQSREVEFRFLTVRQLDVLRQESRQLHETLLNIEKLLSARLQSDEPFDLGDLKSLSAQEGHWPAASIVRDMINRQERQVAFGHWQRERNMQLTADNLVFFENTNWHQSSALQHECQTVEKYDPTADNLILSKLGMNLDDKSRLIVHGECKQEQHELAHRRRHHRHFAAAAAALLLLILVIVLFV